MGTAPSEHDVATDRSRTRALVRSILQDPDGRPWVMQDIGLMALRIGDRREHRLHLWDPGDEDADPPIHDHPFDFTSTVVAGRITNARFVECASGVEYQRDRYSPSDEQQRVTDTVRLSSTSDRHAAGEIYHQAAHELHRSTQLPGTVTVLRCTFMPVDRLTVCQAPGRPWISGRSRPPTVDEVRRITATALDVMG